jgi:capsular exopolysaccharide synthesis family protein
MSNLVPGQQGPLPTRVNPVDGDPWDDHGIPYRRTADDGEINVREFWHRLRRHFWLLLGSVILGTAIAAYAVMSHVPQYMARATIRISNERQALTGGLEAEATEQMLGKGSDPLLSHMQVLGSRQVLGRVVDSLRLQIRASSEQGSPAIFSDFRSSTVIEDDTLRFTFSPKDYIVRSGGRSLVAGYGAPVTIAGTTFRIDAPPVVRSAEFLVIPHDRAVAQLASRLEIMRRANTDVIDVEYTSGDAVRSAAIVNAIVDAFQFVDTNNAQQQSRRRRVFAEEQLAATDSILVDAQAALQSFRTREGVYSPQDRLSAEQSASMALDARREELRSDRQVYASLLSRLQTGANGRSDRTQALISTPGLANSPVVAQLSAQLLRLQSVRDSLTIGAWASSASNPDVARIDTMLASTEQRIAAFATGQLAALDARIEALDDLEIRNGSMLESLPAAESEEMRLAQRVETTRKIADQLREEYQKARIAEAVEAGQVDIVDHAVVPRRPLNSRAPLTIALGILLGLLFGSAGAFLVERSNTSIRRKDDMEFALQIPGLAVIPRMTHTGTKKLKKSLIGLNRSAFAVNGNGSNSNGAGLITLSDLRSSGAEAFRSLRTNLIFSQAISQLKRFVITSPAPTDGKTTTAANLAVTFAQQGLRVLLVDADLRRPRMHEMFDLPRSPGLTDVLVERIDVADAVRTTVVPNLFLLPAGTTPPNPSELLGGERTFRLLDLLNAEYNLVIIDSPPLLAASDAMILGRNADGVLLVIRAGKTEKLAAQHAVQQLNNVGARIIGAVLNDPDAKIPQYGDYASYAYAGYYGE